MSEKLTSFDVSSKNISSERISRLRVVRQFASVLKLEWQKNISFKRLLIIFIITALPTLLCVIPVEFEGVKYRLNHAQETYAMSFFIYYSTAIFFCCSWFSQQFLRKEVNDQTLHYYFLAPVSRQLILLGKVTCNTFVLLILFTIGVIVFYLYLFSNVKHDTGIFYLYSEIGVQNLVMFVCSTVIGVIGYCSLFLIASFLFKNLTFPTILIYGWEWLNPLLPSLLKKFSVVHYMRSITPENFGEFDKFIQVISDPTSLFISIPLFTVLVLLSFIFAFLKIKNFDISYTN